VYTLKKRDALKSAQLLSPTKMARCLRIELFVYRPLMAPDWNDWGWKVDPKFLEEARAIWGLKAA
jgi:hypothetical protein